MDLLFPIGFLFHLLLILCLVLSIVTTIHVLDNGRRLSVLEIIIALFLTWSFPLVGSVIAFYLTWRRKEQLKQSQVSTPE